MSHKKMLQCSMGALLLLLPWFGGLVLGEISDDFSECLKFFYSNIPPTGLPAGGDQYQPICQFYKNDYRFATLYHRGRRSPLYSAYILRPSEETFKRPESTWMYEPQCNQNLRKCPPNEERFTRPKPTWMYEPQLVSRTAGKEMKRFPSHVDQNVMKSQAVDKDYTKSGYTRGHLNPSGHKTISYSKATFTLTNIVPQKEGSNNGPWSKLEEAVVRKFKEYCTGTMHVITGVMPYASGTHLINKRVSVPEYMWSAYCCTSFKSNLPKPEKASFPTYAAVGRNDPDSTEEIVPKKNPKVKGYDVKRMSLEELEKILSERLGGTINLFNGRCRK